VNLALLYLYVRWMEKSVAAGNPSLSELQLSEMVAPLVGNLNASTMLGMAIGGLSAGILIPSGREKWPLVAFPLLFAPAIALFPIASREFGYVLAVLAGIGFASMVPVTLAVAQRLLPTRTSLASGLMLGGAWSVAMLGPVLAEWIVRAASLELAFYLTAGLLAVSGVILVPIRAASFGQSVGR
jgi:MFS family permease